MAFRALLAAGCAIAAATLTLAQTGSPYCDAASGICFVGYTDTDESMTMGVVLPPLSDPPSDEYIVQLVAPVSYGWSGISMGGAMTNSLLFPMWPNGNEIMVGPRWADDYVLPDVYSGPTITLLSASTINSTHINAIWRCQNCTVWEGGSFGSGNLNGTAVLAYVSSSTTGPADPSDIDSTFQEHDFFGFFGMDLSTAHSNSYSSYIGGSSSSSTAGSSPSSTSTAPAAGQTVGAYGQCGGNGYTGPTTCTSGYTCVAVSPPYYSQCQPSQ